MPRSTFALGALNGATPGLSRLAASLSGGGSAYDTGFDKGATLQSKLAQAIANIRAHDASADASTAKAEQDRAETGILSGRGDAIDDSVAMSTGSTIPMVRAVQEFTRTGVRPMKESMGPVDENGTPATPFPVVDDGTQSKIAQALSRMLTMRTNLKDTKPDDLAKAQSIYREGDLSDAVIAGKADRNTVGGAQAAAAGKPMYHADSTGAVLDQFRGGLDTSNPMAGSTINLRTQQAGQAKAGAAENYAQAGAAGALTNLRTAQTGAVGAGPGRVPVGYRYTSDPETGAVRLEPIPGGPKDPNAQTGKPLPASAAKGLLENQTNLRRAQTALQLIEGGKVGDAQGDPEATGWKALLPNQVLNRVDPKGVATRAAIADLGSLVIHDRSGAAVTASEFPRLAPFIPTATDDNKTIRAKLRQFVKNYQDEVGGQVDFYRASGFNVPAEQLRGAGAPTAGDGRNVQVEY